MGAWAGGSTRIWRRVRRRVLDENRRTNQGRCVLALAGICTGQAEQVHHTLGRAITGDDPRYLVAACRACNLATGQPSTNEPPHRTVTDW